MPSRFRRFLAMLCCCAGCLLPMLAQSPSVTYTGVPYSSGSSPIAYVSGQTYAQGAIAQFNGQLCVSRRYSNQADPTDTTSWACSTAGAALNTQQQSQITNAVQRTGDAMTGALTATDFMRSFAPTTPPLSLSKFASTFAGNAVTTAHTAYVNALISANSATFYNDGSQFVEAAPGYPAEFPADTFLSSALLSDGVLVNMLNRFTAQANSNGELPISITAGSSSQSSQNTYYSGQDLHKAHAEHPMLR